MKLIVFLLSLPYFMVINASLDVKIVLRTREGDRSEQNGNSCDSGLLFEEPQEINCACVTGVWAFYGAWCSHPEAIVAGSNFCFQLPRGLTSQISLLSSSKNMFSSTLARMTPRFEQLKEKIYEDSEVHWDMTRAGFVSTGEDSWELRTGEGKSYCLQAIDELDSYCTFSTTQLPERLRSQNVTRVKRGCSAKDATIVKPFECHRYYRGAYGDERTCAEIEAEQLESSTRPTSFDSYEDSHNYAMEDTDPDITMKHTAKRHKRQAPPAPAKPVPNPDDDDSDWLDPAQRSVINHPIVLQELRAYMDARISGSAGTATKFVANTRGIPVFLLLQQAMLVMQRTCNVVNPSHFELAYNTFTNIQVQNYHVKEAYLAEPEFARIRDVLNLCYLSGQPHKFISNETLTVNTTTNGTTNLTSLPNDTCAEVELPKVSTVTEQNKELFNLKIEEGKGGRGFEPIVETVWKIFINAHSYCYRHFSEYYNDHHTFGTALLSVFTNEIQHVWFNTTVPDGTYVEPAAGLLLYGGIIGPHRELIDSIDLCVAASRTQSRYPWLLSRPPLDTSNKWFRRRKRSLSTGPSCLKTPQSTASLYSQIGYGRCD